MIDDGGITERPATQVISEASGRAQRPGLANYASELFGIFCNFPSEVRHFGKVPCAKRSLYTGILAGGLVSALTLVITGTVLLQGIANT